MAEKKKEMTPEQASILKRRGLVPEHYVVLLDCPQSMLVRNTVTMTAGVIYKQDLWKRVPQ